MTPLYESDVEEAAMGWLSTLGWQTAYGPDIAPDTPGAERTDFILVVLEERLRDALINLNPSLPQSALETGLRNLINPEGPTPEAETGPSTTPSPGGSLSPSEDPTGRRAENWRTSSTSKTPPTTTGSPSTSSL